MNAVEAAYTHLRLAKNCIKADIAMRNSTSGSIPCPECAYGGTIAYRYIPVTEKIIGTCSAPTCAQFC